MADPLRILIVDDSALMRRMLRELLSGDSEVSVVGEAANGREALALVAELRPSLVTLDVRMPVMDGVETTRQIMAYHPTPILVLTASLSSYDVDITFQMLGLGALDVMEKPRLTDPGEVERARRALLRKVKLLARVRVVTHLRGRRSNDRSRATSDEPDKAQRVPAPVSRHPSLVTPVVVIGASTGGPRVVRQILASLPRDFPAAVLVVQHIAQGFSAGMAEWLGLSSALPVELVTEGKPLRVGVALVAPDRYDTLLQSDGRLHLSSNPLLLQRPSVDITMQSVAEMCGPRAAGVLLTGMGRDGAIGLLAIRRAGGYTIAQDEASCTIYGMPRAAVELAAADAILPPEQIPAALVARVMTKRL
jgi:two-component system chemotaxis response regulator CheB